MGIVRAWRSRERTAVPIRGPAAGLHFTTPHTHDWLPDLLCSSWKP